jgi:CRISPR-associated protein Cas2
MMLLIKTSNVPTALTGYLSRYLMELESGLFVGKVNRRLADHLWSQTETYAKDGYATGVLSGGSELGFTLRSHNHPTLTIKDMDGLTIPIINSRIQS